MSSTRTRGLVATGLAALVVLGAGPAQAAGSPYVALGDSYSSGTGTGSYLSDGTSCQRSAYAYPSLIAAARGYALDLRACAGATTADVTRVQLGALGPGTAFVTITAGGNDTGFADVLTDCAKPAWASSCGAAIDRGLALARDVLPARLSALYAAVRSRAPQAEVVVGGYPRVFNGQDCNAATWFSPTEMTRLNASADVLNSRIAAAASAAGFAYSSPTAAFTGHAVCDRPEWLNGLSSPVSASYHPNRLGHSAGYTPLVSTALTGSRLTVTATTRARAAASAEQLAARQRPYAAADRTITPRPFRVPDLASPQVQDAAARAGVDLSSRSSIDRLDRVHQARQDARR